MLQPAGSAPGSLVVAGTRVDLIERGSGRPLLFLHPENGIEPALAAIDELAKSARVIAPTHPGFGRSELAGGMRTVDDLSYFYLDFLDQLDLTGLTVVGVSFGAWIAAEIAVKSTARLSRLVMANAVGVKVGDRETRDIADIFAITDPEYLAMTYCDPAVGRRDYKALPDAEVLAAARAREATARFEAALALEYRLTQHVMAAHDFYEGVRAALIDKDQKPRWQPGNLAQIDDRAAEAYFAPLGDKELAFD